MTDVTRTAYPKISLVGHPSDGFGGATIGLTISNFAADVTATPSTHMAFGAVLQASEEHAGAKATAAHYKRYGYDDGTRLLRAALVRFVTYCEARGIALPDESCALQLRTTVPRQIGMGGSSAIVRAALDALAAFYDVAIGTRDAVTMALEAETLELGIQAGLMDRIAQAYDGAVYFCCGADDVRWSATRVDSGLLPQLFLAYRSDLAKLSSGGVLSPLAVRFREGDAEVRAIMTELRDLAAAAHADLVAGDRASFLARLDAGMDCRRRLLPSLDPRYFALVDIGRTLDAHVTFTGSGGAVVGAFDSPAHFAALAEAYGKTGATFLAITPTTPRTTQV